MNFVDSDNCAILNLIGQREHSSEINKRKMSNSYSNHILQKVDPEKCETRAWSSSNCSSNGETDVFRVLVYVWQAPGMAGKLFLLINAWITILWNKLRDLQGIVYEITEEFILIFTAFSLSIL